MDRLTEREIEVLREALDDEYHAWATYRLLGGRCAPRSPRSRNGSGRPRRNAISPPSGGVPSARARGLAQGGIASPDIPADGGAEGPDASLHYRSRGAARGAGSPVCVR